MESSKRTKYRENGRFFSRLCEKSIHSYRILGKVVSAPRQAFVSAVPGGHKEAAKKKDCYNYNNNDNGITKE